MQVLVVLVNDDVHAVYPIINHQALEMVEEVRKQVHQNFPNWKNGIRIQHITMRMDPPNSYADTQFIIKDLSYSLKE